MGYQLRFDEENADVGWKMTLSSPDFAHEGDIPERFTCKGDDISPSLRIDSAPLRTREFALIVTDPDSPEPDFVHWVAYGIDSGQTVIAEGAAPGGAREGMNDFGKTGYGGPCPHEGRHHYVFTLYALDARLDLNAGMKAADLRGLIRDHILAQAELIGLFGK
jgi:Raf kinase inhibitor-like YbhB/YbcL family protein